MTHKRVERIWRQEGLQVPQKQPKRGRLWLADGAWLRRRPEYPNHVWASEVLMERTRDGRPVKLLTVVDEDTRDWLAIAVRHRLTSHDGQEVLSDVFLRRGCPIPSRSDNGPEFIARALQAWYRLMTVAPFCIEPGSPWEHGSGEAFNGTWRDAWLNGELFYTWHEVQVLVGRWRQRDNAHRPQSARGHRPPAPDTRTVTPMSDRSA